MIRDPAILLLALGETLIWAASFYAFPALLLRWELDLGWSKPELTAAITLAILVSALAAPVVGRFIDRGFGVPMIGAAAVLVGICLCLLSQVSELWQFYCIWSAMGLAMAGCLYEPCFAMITRARSADARRGIILITLVAGFAGTISFPSFHVLSEAMGWRNAVFWVGVGVVLVVAPILWSGASRLDPDRGDVKTAQAEVPGRLDRSFLKRPTYLFLSIAFALIAITHGAVIQHVLPLLDERGVSPSTAVLAAACIGPMQVVGRLAMMASERVLSTSTVALASFAVHCLAISVLWISGASFLMILLFILLLGAAFGTMSILRPVLTRDFLGDRDFGVKSSAVSVPFLVGAAFSPFLGSVLWSIGGYGLMVGVLVFLGALAVLVFRQAVRCHNVHMVD